MVYKIKINKKNKWCGEANRSKVKKVGELVKNVSLKVRSKFWSKITYFVNKVDSVQGCNEFNSRSSFKTGGTKNRNMEKSKAFFKRADESTIFEMVMSFIGGVVVVNSMSMLIVTPGWLDVVSALTPLLEYAKALPWSTLSLAGTGIIFMKVVIRWGLLKTFVFRSVCKLSDGLVLLVAWSFGNDTKKFKILMVLSVFVGIVFGWALIEVVQVEELMFLFKNVVLNANPPGSESPAGFFFNGEDGQPGSDANESEENPKGEGKGKEKKE